MTANSQVEVYAEGERLPLYSGIVQSAEAKEENGLRMICLQLSSGSILLDMEKKSRSYQNTGMSYGEVINEALAPWNTAAIYPSSLSGTAIGFPVIQYQETDWQFVKRMASRGICGADRREVLHSGRGKGRIRQKPVPVL